MYENNLNSIFITTCISPYTKVIFDNSPSKINLIKKVNSNQSNNVHSKKMAIKVPKKLEEKKIGPATSKNDIEPIKVVDNNKKNFELLKSKVSAEEKTIDEILESKHENKNELKSEELKNDLEDNVKEEIYSESENNKEKSINKSEEINCINDSVIYLDENHSLNCCQKIIRDEILSHFCLPPGIVYSKKFTIEFEINKNGIVSEISKRTVEPLIIHTALKKAILKSKYPPESWGKKVVLCIN